MDKVEQFTQVKEGLHGTLYTIESKPSYPSYPELIVRDNREKDIFKLKKTGLIGHNYKIFNAQNVEVGKLIRGTWRKFMTIREKETGFESKISNSVSKERRSVTTPSERYSYSNRMVSDQAFIVNMSDSQARQVLSIERSRQSGKGCLWGIIRNFGNLSPFLACAIGVSLFLYLDFIMNYPDVELLDKSTEVKIERKGFRGDVFVYRDKNGIEMFRGKRSWFFSSSFVFTHPSGKLIGEITRRKFRKEWVITDSQRKITGILNLKIAKKERLNRSSGDSPPFTLVVGKETFSLRNLMQYFRELYDRDGNLSYAIFGYNKLFTLDIKDSLTPNFWCFLSVCLIKKFLIPKPQRPSTH